MVTGAAGFVGMHTAIELKRLGMTPIGYDNVNDYYSIDLKEKRINELKNHNIPFVKGDVCDAEKLKATIKEYKITRFIHLAAQAGVRYSLDHPLEYTKNNVECTVTLLEVMNELDLKDTLVYASSSSVYGNNVNVPFRETDVVADPASLYAATKRGVELIAHTYWNLYNITSIGLRFFTVYGHTDDLTWHLGFLLTRYPAIKPLMFSTTDKVDETLRLLTTLFKALSILCM